MPASLPSRPMTSHSSRSPLAPYPSSRPSASKSSSSTGTSTSTSTGTNNRPKSRTRLFVSSLSPGVNEAALATIYKPYGSIKDLHLVFYSTGELKGRSRGYAFVEFARMEDAEMARVNTDGRLLAGKNIRVGFADVRVSGDVEHDGWWTHARVRSDL
ncbi:RNA-binding domain-containing protein [Ceraceosorus guamensis]|uniref:RNA-binding domain-containing protein n=1 Tax=Ceraceosorus guamensis TaxID=1522189 RepID=A0A316VUV4_9BASI|nr:RNA-binding domain-containing protein [Ceraceosorus guamensis]PWN41240.1 RNA-binding domain-containing protein [Ceraceosorus guamensis]